MVDYSHMERKTALIQLGAAIHNESGVPPSGIVQDIDDQTLCTFNLKYPLESRDRVLSWLIQILEMSEGDAKALAMSGTHYGVEQFRDFELVMAYGQFHDNKQPLLFAGCLYTELGPVPKFEPMPEMVERHCYLVVTEDKKAVTCFFKEPSVAAGEVAVAVNIRIPKALFHSTRISANIEIPESEGLSEEAMVDLKTAIGMAYGKAVHLIVEPAHGSTTAKHS
jgi:hypothetical protein